MSAVIEVSVAHRLGAFALDADFASDGRLTALFGRSGSGKTDSGLNSPARAGYETRSGTTSLAAGSNPVTPARSP